MQILLQSHYNFRDISKLLAIALKSSGSDPHILKHILCPFHTKFSKFIHIHEIAMKKKLTPMYFLLNSPSHALAK